MVFFIPLTVFFIIINTFYIRNLREELVATQENVLQQTSSLLDEQIIEVSTIGNRINHSREFISQGVFNQENHTEYTGLLELYQESSRAISEIFVMIDNNPTIFSAKGTMSIDAMRDLIRFFDIIDQDKLMDTFESTESQLLVHTLDNMNRDNTLSNKVIYYTMPLNGASDKRGTIIFVMDLNPVIGNLKASTSETGVSFLVDTTGNVISAVGQTDIIEELEMEAVIEAAQKHDNIDLQSASYFPTLHINPISQWTLVTLTENNQFFQPLNQVIFLFVVLIIFAVLLGTGISIFFAMRSYRPVQNLASILNPVNEPAQDEFSLISSHIDKTKTELELLNNLMDEQAPIIRNAALMHLIEGSSDDQEVLEQRLNDAEIMFHYHLFSVAIIEISESPEDAKRILNIETIANKLNDKELQPKNIMLEATVPFFRNNRIIVICNITKDDSTSWALIKDFMYGVMQDKKLSSSSVLQMGIGNVYNELTEISKSYIEASSAIDMLGSEALSSEEYFVTLHFKDINRETQSNLSDSIQFLREETLVLQQSIKQGHQKMAFEVINNYFNELGQQTYYDIANQMVTSDLVNTVLKTANELNIAVDLQDFYDLSDFNQIEKTRHILLDLTELICIQVEERQSVQSQNIEKHVVQYIYDNFDSPNISLEEIASENDISISYVSKLVKEETGESFSNILQNLRMNKFKQLLIETDEPIKVLVQAVGYYDVSNFTRKFRQENGTTPGEYRKRIKKSQMI